MERKKAINKTRRKNNEGSIYHRKDGRWSATVTVGYFEDGKPQRVTFYCKTKNDALQKINEVKNRTTSLGKNLANKRLSEVMLEWIMVFKKSEVASRTFSNNIELYHKYIIPNLGGMKISEIDDVCIQKLLVKMLDKGLCLDRVKKCKYLLGQFFDYLVDKDELRSNPVKKVKVKSKDRKIQASEGDYKAVPQDKRMEFIKCLSENDFLKPLCFVMLFAGLRVGEALALQWRDIDFDLQTIKIERAITLDVSYDESGKVKESKTVISSTKTVCSVRQVPMPEILKCALLDYRKRQVAIGQKHNVDLLTDKSLVFGNKDGSLRTYTGTRHILNRFLVKHDLNDLNIHFHTLRHTFSNILFEAEKNPKAIQRLMGHRSVKTTIGTYNSVDKDDIKKAADVFNEKYRPDTISEKLDIDIKNMSNAELNSLIKQLTEMRKTQETKKVNEKSR